MSRGKTKKVEIDGMKQAHIIEETKNKDFFKKVLDGIDRQW